MPMCAGFCQIRSGLNAQHPPVSADCQRLRDGHKLQLLAALFIPLALAPFFARLAVAPHTRQWQKEQCKMQNPNW